MKKAILVLFALLISAAGYSQQLNTSVNGFDALLWGSSLDDVKKSIRGKMRYTDNKSVVISRENEITYRYGFFFIDVENVEAPKADAAAPVQDKTLPMLFFVTLEFPYIFLDDIKKKYAEKYGEPNFENITNNSGALVWDLEKTRIVVWVDQYEKKPYVKKVNYVSKDISKEAAGYASQLFTKKELSVLKDLRP